MKAGITNAAKTNCGVIKRVSFEIGGCISAVLRVCLARCDLIFEQYARKVST